MKTRSTPWRKCFRVRTAVLAISLAALILGIGSCRDKTPEATARNYERPNGTGQLPRPAGWTGELAQGTVGNQTFTLVVPPSMYSDSAGKLATLFAMCCINPDQVPSFVRQNAAAFEDTGELNRQAARFRSAVMSEVLGGPDRNFVRAHITDIHTRAGGGLPPEIIRGTEDDIMRGKIDLVRTAEWTAQVSGSLEGILQGDDRLYRQTEGYTYVKMGEPGMQLLVSMYGPDILAFFYNVQYAAWAYPLLSRTCE